MLNPMQARLICAASLAIAPAAQAQPGFSLIPVLPGTDQQNGASAVSLDGNWIVGASRSFFAPAPDHEAFRWSAASGSQSLGPLNGDYWSTPTCVSADGSVVAGNLRSNHGFRWTEATGKAPLGAPPVGTNPNVQSISADGNILVGWIRTGSVDYQGFIWTPANGFTFVPGVVNGRAIDISADGRLVVGYGNLQPPPPSEQYAYRWTVGEPEPHSLGPLAGTTTSTIPGAISPDGAIIGGIVDLQGDRPVAVWTEQHGYVTMPAISGRPYCLIHAVADGGTIVAGHCADVLGNSVATIWRGPGPQGPYQSFDLNLYLPQIGIPLPPDTHLTVVAGMSGDGRILAGSALQGPAGRAFRVEFCYANCNGSTTAPYLSVDDFTCFIDRFAHAQSLPLEQQRYHYANCDKSTSPPILTVNDFTCFINEFAQGCDTP